MALTPYPFTRGDAMDRALKEAGLKPKEAAALMGLGYRTIRNWLNDDAMPSGENLVRFVELTEADWLYDWFTPAGARSSCMSEVPGQQHWTMAA